MHLPTLIHHLPCYAEKTLPCLRTKAKLLEEKYEAKLEFPGWGGGGGG